MNAAGEGPGQQPLNEPLSYKDLTQTPNNDVLVLSDREKEILALWDQAEELRLEAALLEIQRSGEAAGVPDTSDDVSEEHMMAAEREALAARSEYQLRNKIVQSFVVSDPILKAVHGGANSSALERRLFPLINERDVLAMLHGLLSTRTVEQSASLTDAERENIELMEKNQKLAQEVLSLANQLKTQDPHDVQDDALRQEILKAKDSTSNARKRWRILKSVVAGTIVGSGINWARDETLTNLVLDDEEELG